MLLYALLALYLGSSSQVVIPAGTELSVRLSTKVGSKTSKANDPVEAVLIAPAVAGGQLVLPAGAKLHGQVKQVRTSGQPNDSRAMLELVFGELEANGHKTNISARVTDVDNARESVDAESGQILGILGSQTLSARMDQGINRVAERFSGLADVLQVAKTAVLKESDPEVEYEPGVEMTVKLTKELKLDTPPPAPTIASISPEDELVRMVTAQPFQTVAESPPKPSDVTNLMFIGSEQVLKHVFTTAGWSVSAEMSGVSKLETFRAIAEARGYKEAPMSILILDGQKPSQTFQKQNNTFASRHHLRIWRRPATFQGKTVWVCAATHDIGIDFSPENRTFIHKIDSNIDRERAKVVSDLVFTGLVKGLALVERPAVPTSSMNATGDKLETDGAIAVLLLE